MHWNPAVGIPLFLIGLLALFLIWFFGRSGEGRQQKKRTPEAKSQRKEPSFDALAEQDSSDEAQTAPLEHIYVSSSQGTDAEVRRELESLRDSLDVPDSDNSQSAENPNEQPGDSTLGRRSPDSPVDRIVNLFVVADEGDTFHGTDLIVAMDKAGLVYGDMQIFHRLPSNDSQEGAVFSVANMIKPGYFQMNTMAEMETPGLTFFITLPGPLSALDSWDTMLPTAQRLAELLNGHVLDEGRNTLSRQSIAFMRDDLRSWDRMHNIV